MYERILLPTDGSEHAENAAEHAIDLADRYGAELHAFYVIWPGAPYGSVALPELPTQDVESALEKHAESSLARIEAMAKERGLTTTSRIVHENRIGNAILDYADEAGIDLIVMGTHGRTGLERFLLGSVAEHVLRKASVPVMTVHLDAETG